MIARIPTARELLFWRIHFALAVLCAVDAVFGLGSVLSDMTKTSATGRSSSDVFFMIALPLPLIVGPLIAEAGYVFQRALLRPFVWSALLMICVLLWVVGILLAGAFVMMADAPVPSPAWWEVAVWVIALMQLIPMWRYAYRSGHLWMPVTA